MKLKHARVRRGGSSTWERSVVNTDVELQPEASPPERGIELSLSVPVSSGYSDIEVLIGTEDFPALVKAMADADRDAALVAMAGEVLKRLSSN